MTVMLITYRSVTELTNGVMIGIIVGCLILFHPFFNDSSAYSDF